ncbi:hypothetical protein MMC07_007434, partial [Pseudocyphellaria aurata]|nr:hypothetical protein [Pseudocyphellaria aurata]
LLTLGPASMTFSPVSTSDTSGSLSDSLTREAPFSFGAPFVSTLQSDSTTETPTAATVATPTATTAAKPSTTTAATPSATNAATSSATTTATLSATATETPTAVPSSSSGLSDSAKVGLSMSIPLGAIILFLLCRKKRYEQLRDYLLDRNKQLRENTQSHSADGEEHQQQGMTNGYPQPTPWTEFQTPLAELQSPLAELPQSRAAHELASEPPRYRP